MSEETGRSRIYTKEERITAVELFLKSGKPFEEAAKEFGVGNNTLRRWVDKYGPAVKDLSGEDVTTVDIIRETSKRTLDLQNVFIQRVFEVKTNALDQLDKYLKTETSVRTLNEVVKNLNEITEKDMHPPSSNSPAPQEQPQNLFLQIVKQMINNKHGSTSTNPSQSSNDPSDGD